MKRIFKRILSIILCVTMLITSVISLGLVSAGTTVEYVKDSNGNRTGIKNVNINGVNYYDVYSGNKLMDSDNRTFFKKVLTAKNNNRSVLDMWANVASLIFESGDKFGFQNNGFESFDKSFTSDGDNGINLIRAFSDQNSYLEDNNPKDFSSTGLAYASSLSAVQSEMASQIHKLSGNKEIYTQGRIYKYCTGSESGFDLLNDSDYQDVFYNIVTAYDHNGSKADESFSSFALAFYDFEVVPLIDNSLQYVTAAEGYDSLKEASGNPGVEYSESTLDDVYTSYIRNPSSSPSMVSVSFSDTSSISVSNSMEATKSYSIGTQLNESVQLTTSISKVEEFSYSLSAGISTEEAISTAYGNETSKTDSKEYTTSTEVELPAHSQLEMMQTTGVTDVLLKYSCPVYVTYKVAIFAMNGSIEVSGSDEFDFPRYDQGGMCVLFGSGNPVEGYSAVEHLYNRAIADGHEESLTKYNSGYFENHGDGDAPERYTSVKWENFIDSVQQNGTASARICIEHLKNNIPLSASGAELTIQSKSTKTDITGITPLYDLDSVKVVDSAAYNLAVGNSLDLSKVATAGYNVHSVPYYGYISGGGTWKLCDVNGNVVDSVEGASISDISGNQIFNAEKEGTYYLKFFIDENLYSRVNEEDVKIKNSDLSVQPVLIIKATRTEDGSHECTVGSWRTSIPATCSTEGEKCSYCSICGVLMETKPIEKLAHIEVEAETPATCKSDGVIKTTCGACGTVISTENLPKISHTLGAWNITAQATCTRTGEKQQTCSSCGEVINTEIIPALGHTEGVWVQTLNATCTEDGVETLSCTSCGYVIDVRPILSTGHDEGIWKIDFEATPEHEGQKTRYCSKCNEALETQAFEKHEHTEGYRATVVTPTCTAKGEGGIYCGECGAMYDTYEIAAAGHDEGTWVISKDATCVSEGEEALICTACEGVIGTRKISVKGHVKGISIETKAPTCTASGELTSYCECCGAAVETIPVNAQGHDGGIWKIDFEATSEHDGQKSKYCSKCGEVLETASFKKHEHTEGYRATVVAPTCTAKGEGGIYCGECGAVYGTYEISETGHGNGVWVVSIAAMCETAGEEICVCEVCSETIGKREINALGHNEGVSVIAVQPTCVTDGERISKCTRCSSVCGVYKINKLNHNNSEWHTLNDGTHSRICLNCKTEEVNNCRYNSVITAPTCVSGGYTTNTCSVCSYKFIDESTEMLGHEWSEWKNNGNGHTRECIRNGCNAAESNEHNWGEWIDNGDESVSENGTKTRICVDCSASETVEAEYSSQFWQVFRPIIVFAGNFVHKIIYLLSLNWLFPEITIPQ